MRKKQKKLENVYSNYTLNKIKTFILKRIDVIEISYDELKLHHAKIFGIIKLLNIIKI